MAEERMFYADLRGHFSPPREPLKVNAGLKLDLAAICLVPPEVTTIEEIIKAQHEGLKELHGQKNLRLIRYPSDLDSIGNGVTGVVCELENPPKDLNIGEENSERDNIKTNLQRLRDAGILIIALAYRELNAFGGGYRYPYARLTPWGDQFLSVCRQVGMIVDLSGAGHQTAWDALIHPTGVTFIASHGACYEVNGCYNPRNLPRAVLRKIAMGGGMVGIYTRTFGLHPSQDLLAHFCHHVEAAVESCGVDAVAIGSDGVYVKQAESVLRLERSDPDRCPPDQLGDLNRPDRMEVLREELSRNDRGEALVFSPEDVAKIMGLNILRFLKRALKST
ncbi:MAG: membrane dipeptidase [Parcubacteria group bacterium]|nr:membrane dipeptidase [Parcubacteria group bacterium]